jgi:hypothetical protein
MKFKKFIKNYGILSLFLIGFISYAIFVMPLQFKRVDIIMEGFTKLGWLP